METFDATIRAIYKSGPSWSNPSGLPFVTAGTTCGQTVKGHMRSAKKGLYARFWGEWRPQKGYPPAFEFAWYEPLIDKSRPGLEHYLAEFVDGIGWSRAKKIVGRFGEDTLKVVCENPQALAEIGIQQSVIDLVARHFSDYNRIDPMAYATLVDMLKPYRVPKKVLMSLLDHWGSDAPGKVQEMPYFLLAYPGMGWKSVDAIATGIGYPGDGIDRQTQALVEALEVITGQGHTYASRVEVETEAFKLIGMIPCQEAWDKAIDEILVTVNEDDTYSLPKIADAEQSIVNDLLNLLASGKEIEPIDPGKCEDEQAQALEMIASNSVSIITGAPGVGKTFVVTQALSALSKRHFTRFTAPTGKAAKRGAELLEQALPGNLIQCSTIHKLLGPKPSVESEDVPGSDAKFGRGRNTFGFTHNRGNPLPHDLLVLDEASMADVNLTRDFLAAVAPGTRVVIVGDPNQLPPVGPGSFLRDAIAGGIPSVKLTKVRRNCGTIVRAAHDILGGKAPTPAKRIDLEAKENYFHLERQEPPQILEEIVRLHERVKMFDPLADMQVISPENRKPYIGCGTINESLSAILNKHENRRRASRSGHFCCGDKVVRTKNGIADLIVPCGKDERHDWRWNGQPYRLDEVDVVNGDMGTVVDITEEEDPFVVVHLTAPDRLCRMPIDNCHLSRAYAMTTHKAQGSGFKYVILPVHDSFFYDTKRRVGLWNREMIYTMFSRAETLLITVGPFSSIELAVSRPTVHQRRTRMKSLFERAAAHV